jgi:hypothetical protein
MLNQERTKMGDELKSLTVKNSKTIEGLRNSHNEQLKKELYKKDDFI